jgi:spore germination protein GerM
VAIGGTSEGLLASKRSQNQEVIVDEPRLHRRLVGLSILALIVAACGEAEVAASTTTSVADTSSTTTLVATTTTVDSSSTTQGSTSTTEDPTGQIVQVVFGSEDYSDCSNTVTFDRTIAETAEQVETAFQLLVAGPTSDEEAEGASSFFSAETEGMIRTVQIVDGLLTVGFDDLRPVIPNASTSCGSFSLIAQLNGTAFRFEEVKRVTYQIDGSCDTFFGWLQRDCQEYSRP